VTLTPRERFLTYVRRVPGARPIVSPFLPHADVVQATLAYLGLPVTRDLVEDEVRLAQALDYEPMFMTACHDLIFPWVEDVGASDAEWIVMKMDTPDGPWARRVSRRLGVWGDDAGFPVKTEDDYARLAVVADAVVEREGEIRAYFRAWRERVGEDGVIVIGHPHVTWMGYQVSQRNLIFHEVDYRDAFRRGMDAIYRAACFVFGIAMAEGIDFMSESCSGLEMTSPRDFDRLDLPYLQAFSGFTHARDGLFWYHNCGLTRRLIATGRFDRFAPDVVETIAPPPEGDNDLRGSRRALDPAICSKGNLSLLLLRDGTAVEVAEATRRMVEAVRGYAHIHSTADAVLTGTPPENFIAFVRTAREASSGHN
jgi:hypothetical protein